MCYVNWNIMHMTLFVCYRGGYWFLGLDQFGFWLLFLSSKAIFCLWSLSPTCAAAASCIVMVLTLLQSLRRGQCCVCCVHVFACCCCKFNGPQASFWQQSLRPSPMYYYTTFIAAFETFCGIERTAKKREEKLGQLHSGFALGPFYGGINSHFKAAAAALSPHSTRSKSFIPLLAVAFLRGFGGDH